MSTFSLQLTVDDIATTEAFYGGILELPVSRIITAPGSPDMLVVRQDGCELVFAEESAVVREHPLLEEQLATFPRGVGVALRFVVAGLEEIRDAFEEEGIEILIPLTRHRYGGMELWCYDPDGYLVILEEAVR